MPALVWPLGATPPGMNPLTVRRLKFPKSPTDIAPVTGDFTGALSSLDDDTILPSFTPLTQVLRNDGLSADMFVAGTPQIGPADDLLTRVTVWLVAGSAGFEYLVSITVMSVKGQEITRSFIMPCMLR